MSSNEALVTAQEEQPSQHPTAQKKILEPTSPELRVRLDYVLWKLFISLLVSLAALWAIFSEWENATDRLDFCFRDSSSADPNEERIRFGLCNFQLLNFIFSCVLIFPFLSQALISNMVFFAVITKGDIVSKQQQRTFNYYISWTRKHLPCFLNYDDREENYQGVVLLDYTLEKIKHWTFGERFRRHIVAMIGVFVVIPIIFSWRVVQRSLETVFCFRRIIFNRNYRREWREAWKNVIILPLILCNDPAGVLLLFPLSFVVIFGSQSISETIVNLVAVQVFSRIDDEFVAVMFVPARGIKEIVSLYFPDFDKPRLGKHPTSAEEYQSPLSKLV